MMTFLGDKRMFDAPIEEDIGSLSAKRKLTIDGVTSYSDITNKIIFVRSRYNGTEACTMNVNSLGEKTIKMYKSGNLVSTLDFGWTGAGQMYILSFNGVDFVAYNIYTDTSELVNNTAVTLPFTILGLTSSSTTDEITEAFGGEDNIGLFKTAVERNSMVKIANIDQTLIPYMPNDTEPEPLRTPSKWEAIVVNQSTTTTFEETARVQPYNYKQTYYTITILAYNTTTTEYGSPRLYRLSFHHTTTINKNGTIYSDPNEFVECSIDINHLDGGGGSSKEEYEMNWTIFDIDKTSDSSAIESAIFRGDIETSLGFIKEKDVTGIDFYIACPEEFERHNIKANVELKSKDESTLVEESDDLYMYITYTMIGGATETVCVEVTNNGEYEASFISRTGYGYRGYADTTYSSTPMSTILFTALKPVSRIKNVDSYGVRYQPRKVYRISCSVPFEDTSTEVTVDIFNLIDFYSGAMTPINKSDIALYNIEGYIDTRRLESSILAMLGNIFLAKNTTNSTAYDTPLYFKNFGNAEITIGKGANYSQALNGAILYLDIEFYVDIDID